MCAYEPSFSVPAYCIHVLKKVHIQIHSDIIKLITVIILVVIMMLINTKT